MAPRERSSNGRQRSSEERERDRIERERRRAERRGEPVPPEPAASTEETEPTPPAVGPVFHDDELAGADQGQAHADGEQARDPQLQGEQSEPQEHPEPAADSWLEEEEFAPPPSLPEEAHEPEPTAAEEPDEPAPGAAEVPLHEPVPAHGEAEPWPEDGDQPPPEPEPEPEPEPLPPPRRTVKVGAGTARATAPVTGTAALGPPRGRRAIARIGALVALGLVVVAVVLVVHSLTKSSNSKPLPVPKVVRVLIPEGETGAQIAEIARRDGLSGDYAAASKTSKLLDPTHYGAAHAGDLEGFLFPATYDMNPGEPVQRLVSEQLVAFQENFGAAETKAAKALHITPYQLLIVASMVEKEAEIPGDRPKIAAVIYNRLRAGIPLGIDATIYYAVERHLGVASYTKELTESQLHIDSPYNTRIHHGLPPTPISNPGLASIQAAAHPAKVGYLYYVAGADGCGEQVFSNTQAEFEVDDDAYQEAVRKNGGKPLTCKHH